MAKFYYFLKDNPNYPEMIMAKDKNEVVSLLVNDMGDHGRDMILRILSEEEFTGKPSTEQSKTQISSNDIIPTNDFVQNTLNMLSNQKEEEVQSQPVKVMHEDKNIQVKYFTAGGEHFKLENGILYKKIWIEVTNHDDFRIVKSDTKKPIKSDKYKIETLDWVKAE